MLWNEATASTTLNHLKLILHNIFFNYLSHYFGTIKGQDLSVGVGLPKIDSWSLPLSKNIVFFYELLAYFWYPTISLII